MWPEPDNTGDPFGEHPTMWPPFDMRAAILRECFLDPGIDQPEATRRAWVAYGATITTRRNDDQQRRDAA